MGWGEVHWPTMGKTRPPHLATVLASYHQMFSPAWNVRNNYRTLHVINVFTELQPRNYGLT